MSASLPCVCLKGGVRHTIKQAETVPFDAPSFLHIKEFGYSCRTETSCFIVLIPSRWRLPMSFDKNWWALPLTCTNVTRTIAVFHLLLPKFIPYILMQLCLKWYRCNPGKCSFQGRITLQMSTLLSNAQRRASEEAGFLITSWPMKIGILEVWMNQDLMDKSTNYAMLSDVLRLDILFKWDKLNNKCSDRSMEM